METVNTVGWEDMHMCLDALGACDPDIVAGHLLDVVLGGAVATHKGRMSRWTKKIKKLRS